MASGLFNIVKKEIKEMVRDPRLLLGMIIVPMLMFPLMGMAMSASLSSVEDSAQEIELGVVNLDTGYRSAELLEFLAVRDVRITNHTDIDLTFFIAGTKFNLDLFMEIPANFTSDIEENSISIVVLYTQMQTYSISEGIPSDVISGYLFEYRQMVVNERISLAFPNFDATAVENPVVVNSKSIIDGAEVEAAPSNIANQMMQQSIMMPMVLMILLIMAAQLAATSVAMEKEEKTLETLLTMPVSRSAILFGKISGVIVISAIAVVAYIFGFSIYMNSMNAEGMTLNLAEIGLAPTPIGMVLLFITIFPSLIAALSLSVLVAAFTEDVRSAQALLGVLYVPIFVPSLILMFVDIAQLPGAVQGIVLAIPFSYPVIASKALYTGDYFFVLVGIVYQVIFTAMTIYIAARFFSSEKILTARLSLKRKKGKSPFPLINMLRSR